MKYVRRFFNAKSFNNGRSASSRRCNFKIENLNIETHAIAMKNDGPGAKSADYFEEINIIEQKG